MNNHFPQHIHSPYFFCAFPVLAATCLKSKYYKQTNKKTIQGLYMTIQKMIMATKI